MHFPFKNFPRANLLLTLFFMFCVLVSEMNSEACNKYQRRTPLQNLVVGWLWWWWFFFFLIIEGFLGSEQEDNSH